MKYSMSLTKFVFFVAIRHPRWPQQALIDRQIYLAKEWHSLAGLCTVDIQEGYLTNNITCIYSYSKSDIVLSVKVAAGAMICEECELIGDVTIGAKTIIHPKARIIAEDGPIIIGDNNIIEELVYIVNRNPDKTGGTQQVMIIGNNNIFEVGSYIESTKIGDHNVVEAKGYVGRHLEMTSGCIIGAKCEVKGHERLPENTVISGSDCVRRIAADRPPAQGLQIEFLMKILPNYHYIRRLKSGSSQRK